MRRAEYTVYMEAETDAGGVSMAWGWGVVGEEGMGDPGGEWGSCRSVLLRVGYAHIATRGTRRLRYAYAPRPPRRLLPSHLHSVCQLALREGVRHVVHLPPPEGLLGYPLGEVVGLSATLLMLAGDAHSGMLAMAYVRAHRHFRGEPVVESTGTLVSGFTTLGSSCRLRWAVENERPKPFNNNSNNNTPGTPTLGLYHPRCSAPLPHSSYQDWTCCMPAVNTRLCCKNDTRAFFCSTRLSGARRWPARSKKGKTPPRLALVSRGPLVGSLDMVEFTL